MAVQGAKRVREDAGDEDAKEHVASAARDFTSAFEVDADEPGGKQHAPSSLDGGAAGKQQAPGGADAARRASQRLKQIEYGKSTLGYDAYRSMVPLEARVPGRGDHPVTPDAHSAMSKRAFDAALKAWRRQLHKYDPPDVDEGEDDDTQQAPP
jgi:hypothetical protein